MISQADIIRSLVNKSCTDESIMSTALSPDCTLPKLLQKFTEAERFDLALDVYMKLGMDVVPLWKTWAMRCLRNYEFHGARDKFKHCFQRLRPSAGRLGVASNVLLEDILSELTRMQETKLPLSEMIELIKSRNTICISGSGCLDNQLADNRKITETKPKIYDECLYYLKEYGTIQSLVKFYVDNELWAKAIDALYETKDSQQHSKQSLDGFFISNVIVPAETSGHLDQVISKLLELDPDIQSTSRYFRAIYNHYATKRHNTLYYIQHEMGDYVGAAENQVRNFFLKRPTYNYKELNQRLPSLILASEEYNQHLKMLTTNTSGGLESLPQHRDFMLQMSREASETRLNTIDTQIEITRNFAINEVPGCMNEIEVVVRGPGVESGGDSVRIIENKDLHQDHDVHENSPVTLFDTCPRRRTFLAALVLIFFDLDCSNYISDGGFELANKLINDNELDKLSVFKTAMHIIIEDESSNLIENATLLLKRLRDDYIACTQRSKLKTSANITTSGSTSVDATTNSNPRSSICSASTGSGSNSNNLSKDVISRPLTRKSEKTNSTLARGSISLSPPSTTSTPTQRKLSRKRPTSSYNFELPDKSIKAGSEEAARLLCDEVIRSSIRSCREEDYKMELIKLLSPQAKIVLYIELGKLSVAQRLAFDLKRPEYVRMVLQEAEKLNQDHVKDVCQHWLAKN